MKGTNNDDYREEPPTRRRLAGSAGLDEQAGQSYALKLM
jgi:hypothetical protein